MRYDALHRAQLVQQLEPIASSSSRRFENWARTFTCTPRALFTPTTTHHARLALALARKDARVLRPVGIAHSPSDIAFTNDYLLDTSALTGLVAVDVNARHATFRAGTTLTAVHALLAPYGLAMRNLGSISDQTLAGIVATSTHGSGVRFGVMSTHVLSLTLLTPANCIAFCSRGVQPTQDAPWAPTIAPANVDLFEATVCGLGATGLILEITLELEPAFNLRDTHVVLPFNEFAERLDELKGRAEHVRFWWFPAVGRVRCSFANRTSEPARPPPPSLLHLHNSFLGFHLIQLLLLLTRYARPLPLVEGKNKKHEHEQGVNVDESWRVFNIECRYPQHTTEWALPAPRARACLAELAEWLEGERGDGEGERPHFPIEVRFSAADALWLSPSQGGETCWVGVVQYKPYNLPTRYRALFAAFERILAKHGGRPHWAKAHHLDARATRELYPDFGRFLRVVRDVDPEGTFRNEYIERHLFGGGGDGREYKARR
ncbi:L-gulonolactone D-arabinono-1,4-lactone oxidase, partial [Mycena filopes]